MQKISLTSVDLYLFSLINGYAKKSRVLDFFAIFFAKYLGYLLIFSLIIFAYVNKNWQILWIPLLAGVVARLVINETIYFFFKRKRPLEIMNVNVLIQKPSNASFPSSHASFFFALSFCLLLYNIPVGVIFIAASLFIGFFRVFCGVHWPSDVLGGIVVGCISFLLILGTIKIIL